MVTDQKRTDLLSHQCSSVVGWLANLRRVAIKSTADQMCPLAWDYTILGIAIQNLGRQYSILAPKAVSLVFPMLHSHQIKLIDCVVCGFVRYLRCHLPHSPGRRWWMGRLF